MARKPESLEDISPMTAEEWGLMRLRHNRLERRRKHRFWLGIMWACFLTLAMAGAVCEQAKAADPRLEFNFTRQPDVEGASPWYLCVTSYETSAVTVRLADIYRAAAGAIPLYDPDEVAKAMHFRRRSRWGRVLEYGTTGLNGFSFVKFTGIAKADGAWSDGLSIVGFVGSIAKPWLKENEEAEVGLDKYWLSDRTIMPGESPCARVMSSAKAVPGVMSVVVTPPPEPPAPVRMMPYQAPGRLEYIPAVYAIDAPEEVHVEIALGKQELVFLCPNTWWIGEKSCPSIK